MLRELENIVAFLAVETEKPELEIILELDRYIKESKTMYPQRTDISIARQYLVEEIHKMHNYKEVRQYEQWINC